jgi:hypothetical protein
MIAMRKLGGLAGIAVAVVVLAAASRPSDVFASSRGILSAAVTPKTPCTGYCVICNWGPPQHNAAEYGHGDAGEGDGWHMDCQYPDNCSGHQCDASSPSPEEILLNRDALLRQVSNAVLTSDVAQVKQLLLHNPKRLHFSAERHAVQLTACDGAVVANYPIADRIAEIVVGLK